MTLEDKKQMEAYETLNYEINESEIERQRFLYRT